MDKDKGNLLLDLTSELTTNPAIFNDERPTVVGMVELKFNSIQDLRHPTDAARQSIPVNNADPAIEAFDTFGANKRILNFDMPLYTQGSGRDASPLLANKENVYVNHLVADDQVPEFGHSEPLIDADLPENSRRKSLLRVLAIAGIILSVVAVAFGVYMYGGLVAKWIYDTLFDVFDWIGEFAEPWKCMICFAVSYLLQIFGVPIASLLVMIISFCYNSVVKGFVISFIVCLASNITMHFMFNAAKREKQLAEDEGRATDQVEQLDFLHFFGKLMEKYIHEYPYRFGLMIRTLHLPDYAKMYVLVQYHTSFLQMLVPCVAIDSLNVLLYSFIGSQVKSKFDIISSKSFNQKSLPERIATIAALGLIVVQVCIMICGYIYTRRKYKEYEDSGRTAIAVTPINRRSLVSTTQTARQAHTHKEDIQALSQRTGGLV